MVKRILLIITGVVLLAPTLTAAAQSDCPDDWGDLLAQIAAACTTTPRDSACTGLDSSGIFVSLAENATITSGEAGFVLANVSASLPDAVPGVTMIGLGDVALTDVVPPTARFNATAARLVRAIYNVNLREGPATDQAVVVTLNQGDELQADAWNTARTWVRVAYDGQFAWVRADLVSGDGLGDLPSVDSTIRTPMQDFALRMGDGCDDSILLVQTATDAQPVPMQVNGADFALAGTVALHTDRRTLADFMADDRWMARYQVFLPPETDGLEATTCAFTRLDTLEGDVALNAGAFSLSRGLSTFVFDCTTDGEATWRRTLGIRPERLESLAFLEAADPVLRAVALPTQTEVDQALQRLLMAAEVQYSPTATPVPTVSPAAQPVAPQPTTAPAQAVSNDARPGESLECPGFRPTHPLDIMHFGYVRAYWDPAPGATSYDFRLYNYEQELIWTFEQPTATPNVRVDTMTPALNQNGVQEPTIFYEIIAYQNGQYLCKTQLLQLRRSMAPDPDCPTWMWFTGECEDYVANDP